MRETSFIQQNKEKWKEFELEFDRTQKKDPEKLSSLFIQITDDLSYSRTYYPNRSVKIYLNNLAQKVFFSIYRNRRQRRRRFVVFWKDELPKIMYESRKTLLFTFLLFLLAMGIGILSSMHDPDFARLILGDQYVNMTQENIDKGDPMGVYKQDNSFEVFLAIAQNNLTICFYSFIFGILFGLGTAIYIIYNGVMLGTFQYFFIERGLFWTSFLTIWMHGALEIPSIILAGTAGIELGKGLLFPGTFTRMQSFRMSAIRGMKIILGIAPVILLAACIETFLTRYTDTPDWVRAVFILILFGFMFGYYAIYPSLRAKKGFALKDRPDELTPDKKPEFRFDIIKNNGEIFAESFLLLRQYFTAIFWTCAVLAGGYTFVMLFRIYPNGELMNLWNYRHSDLFSVIWNEFGWPWRELRLFNEFGNNLLQYLVNAASLTILFAISFFVIYSAILKKVRFSWKDFLLFAGKGFIFFAAFAFAFHGMQFIAGGLMNILFYVIFPFICLAIAGLYATGKVSRDAGNISSVVRMSFGSTFFLYLSLLILTYMFLFLSHSTISYLHAELIKWNIPFDEHIYETVTNCIVTFIFTLCTFLSIVLITINMGILYFSHREIRTANELQNRIRHIGEMKMRTS